jgi:hypothetical protein
MASNTTALDFDAIKASLKDYLRGQTQFKDYDFEGAGLNALLDILAYNTHLQALHVNMINNETFLDSAVNRNSITSIAKHLGYTPSSYRSAVAYVNIEFLNRTTDQQTAIAAGSAFVPAGARFLARAGNLTLQFIATTNTKIVQEGAKYYAKNVELKEGFQKSATYVYALDQSVAQTFPIPDLNVDVSSIAVRVSKSSQDTTGSDVLWTKVTDINTLTSDSPVYFLQQNGDLKYELIFGDGILGKKLISGNVIDVSYRTTNGPLGNGIGKNETDAIPVLTYSQDSNTKVLLVKDTTNKPTPTFGGSYPESLESVKYYAPRNYQAQERAVTAEDYRTLLATTYGEQAESVFVWGGEDNDPPIYGKVFISIKPVGNKILTQLEKIAIAKNILKNRNVVSIIPEVVDPDYIFLLLDVTVKYDSAKTTYTAETLASLIKSALFSYTSESIGKFDRDFNYSAYTSYIDSQYAPPIISNNVDVRLQKRLEPNLTTISSYVINFDNELYHPIDGYTSILETTSFLYQDSTSSATVKPNVTAYLDDDGLGNVRIYKITNNARIYLNETLGTIDYTTGKINLTNFAPQGFSEESDNYIKFTVTPKNRDVVSRRNQIIAVESTDITVTAVPQSLIYDPYTSSGTPFPSNS